MQRGPSGIGADGTGSSVATTAAPQSPPPVLAWVESVTVTNPTRVDALLSSYIVYTCIVHQRHVRRAPQAVARAHAPLIAALMSERCLADIQRGDLVIHKRYSEFEKLRDNLVRAHGTGPNPQTLGLPELPGKRMLGGCAPLARPGATLP